MAPCNKPLIFTSLSFSVPSIDEKVSVVTASSSGIKFPIYRVIAVFLGRSQFIAVLLVS